MTTSINVDVDVDRWTFWFWKRNKCNFYLPQSARATYMTFHIVWWFHVGINTWWPLYWDWSRTLKTR